MRTVIVTNIRVQVELKKILVKVPILFKEFTQLASCWQSSYVTSILSNISMRGSLVGTRPVWTKHQIITNRKLVNDFLRLSPTVGNWTGPIRERKWPGPGLPDSKCLPSFAPWPPCLGSATPAGLQSQTVRVGSLEDRPTEEDLAPNYRWRRLPDGEKWHLTCVSDFDVVDDNCILWKQVILVLFQTWTFHRLKANVAYFCTKTSGVKYRLSTLKNFRLLIALFCRRITCRPLFWHLRISD